MDPEKSKKAHKIGLETGQSNLAMIAAEENRHWRDIMVQRDEEKREQIRLDIEREKFERELREKAGLPMPEDAAGNRTDDEDDSLTETDDEPENQPEAAAA